MWVLSLGSKDPLEKELAAHSSILAWKKSQRSLMCYSPWGHKELDTTKRLTHTHTHTHTHIHLNFTLSFFLIYFLIFAKVNHANYFILGKEKLHIKCKYTEDPNEMYTYFQLHINK